MDEELALQKKGLFENHEQRHQPKLPYARIDSLTDVISDTGTGYSDIPVSEYRTPVWHSASITLPLVPYTI